MQSFRTHDEMTELPRRAMLFRKLSFILVLIGILIFPLSSIYSEESQGQKLTKEQKRQKTA